MAIKVSEIQRELSQRIQVEIEWEGRAATDNLREAPKFSFAQTLDMAELTVERLDNETARYQRLLTALHTLRAEVTRLSSRIAEEILELGIDFGALRPDYFDAVARQFERVHRAQCVLVAPEPWLPNLIST